MSEALIIERINSIFSEASYPFRAQSIADIEGFLRDEKNFCLIVYEPVEQLYSELMEDIGL